MSIKIMAQVWEMPNLSPSEKLVLLAYTDHADNEGANMYPAVKTIARKTGLTERGVQLITRGLELKGHLIKDGHGKNGTNRWQFSAVGGESDSGGGVNPIHPNHPLTIILNPLSRAQRRAPQLSSSKPAKCQSLC